MGNSYSDIKNPFGSKNIPGHLQPSKKKTKKKKTKSEASKPDNNKKKWLPADQPLPPPILLINSNNIENSSNDTLHLADEESDFVGSGPRGAFRWFKGRRYLNHADEEDGLNKYVLPNDQLELDRIRVLAFILRWAFRGNVIAPVHDDLERGIKVLNVGYGPGMWPGHHIIDMALDYRNSHFTAVDVLDLMPADFEATENIASNEDGHEIKTPPKFVNNKTTIFTPMHPNLSAKLQNTTTPVIDSSTLDSSLMLSRIDENETSNTSSSIVESSAISSREYDNCSSSTLLDVPVLLSTNGEQTKPCDTPKKRELLHNLDFYQANVLNAKLPFEDNHFDFVKQRLVTASFTVADWKRVMAELVRVTKPGGYIELLEIDHCTHNLGPNGRRWEAQSAVVETMRLKRQLEPRIARYLPDLLKAVGLTDVSSKLVSIPLGSWGLDLGQLWKQNMEKFMESTSPFMSKLVGMTVDEYKAQWLLLVQEGEGRKAFTGVYAAWGRKPLASDGNNDDDIAIDWSLCPPFSGK